MLFYISEMLLVSTFQAASCVLLGIVLWRCLCFFLKARQEFKAIQAKVRVEKEAGAGGKGQ